MDNGDDDVTRAVIGANPRAAKWLYWTSTLQMVLILIPVAVFVVVFVLLALLLL